MSLTLPWRNECKYAALTMTGAFFLDEKIAYIEAITFTSFHIVLIS